MDNGKKTAAVLLCAGSGKRMKGACADKLLVQIGGVPVAAHTLRAFDRSALISLIVIVTGAERIPLFEQLAKEYRIQTPVIVVEGGAKRMDSALRGVRAVPDSFDYVAISDGARPFVKTEDIDRTVKSAFETGAAALGCYVTDTVKEVSGGRITRTVPRENLVAIQTPQVFPRKEYLVCASTAAALNGEDFTDDAAIFERFGNPVAFVEGHYNNIKITTPEDIALLRALAEEIK